MHPGLSVIFFTTASGAGYGLLALLAVAATFGLLPPELWLGLVGLGLALALVTAGLLSSSAHLTHPERAWRAFSQWRSSWLSREGVASVLTYVPAGGFGIAWVFFGRTTGWAGVAGLLTAAGAVVTVSMTAMIYASLKPIAEWHTPFTLPAYLTFAAMTGLTLFNAILQGFGLGDRVLAGATLAAAIVGWLVKLAVWRHNAAIEDGPTAASAIGLSGGTVRSVEWPHTERNYVLKEMGYKIARKHARRLRLIAQALAFALPALLLLLAAIFSGWVGVTLSIVAAPVQLAGMLVERWLFFAEATHVVTLYYGGDKAA